MPRVTINEMNRTGDGAEQFPSIKLDTGELCRMLLPEDDAWCEWVHEIRAPQIGEDNLAVMEVKYRRDKSSYTDYSFRFIARRICLGNPATLDDQGVDGDNCPACASALRGTRDMKPTRRFAVPVIRITAKNVRSTEPRNPVGAEILIWKLTAKMYDKLLDVVPQIRDLLELAADAEFHWRRADVVIKCEDGGWQRMEFQPPMRPAYGTNKALAELIKGLWGEVANRPTGEQLRDACGRTPDRAYMTQEVNDAEAAWRTATNAGTATTADPVGESAMGGAGQQDLDKGLESLLDESTPAAAAAKPDGPADAQDDEADPFAAELEKHPGGLGEFGPRDGNGHPVAPTAETPVEPDPFADTPPADDKKPEPVAAGARAGGPPASSFDDIMKGL